MMVFAGFGIHFGAFIGKEFSIFGEIEGNSGTLHLPRGGMS